MTGRSATSVPVRSTMSSPQGNGRRPHRRGRPGSRLVPQPVRANLAESLAGLPMRLLDGHPPPRCLGDSRTEPRARHEADSRAPTHDGSTSATDAKGACSGSTSGLGASTTRGGSSAHASTSSSTLWRRGSARILANGRGARTASLRRGIRRSTYSVRVGCSRCSATRLERRDRTTRGSSTRWRASSLRSASTTVEISGALGPGRGLGVAEGVRLKPDTSSATTRGCRWEVSDFSRKPSTAARKPAARARCPTRGARRRRSRRGSRRRGLRPRSPASGSGRAPTPPPTAPRSAARRAPSRAAP